MPTTRAKYASQRTTVIRLTDEELTSVKKPIRGSGGFQSLLGQMQKRISNGSLELTREFARTTIRYAEGYKQGGFQNRLSGRIVDACRSIELREQLLEKSIDAYVMALETINRLSVKYRIEAFCYLLCNAWELLLKAKILLDKPTMSAINYTAKPGEGARSITFRSALGRLFTDTQSRVRVNLEYLADLRDAATHLVITDVPRNVIGLFQSCTTNYHSHLHEWFGTSLSDRVSTGMMVIIYDFAPDQFDPEGVILRRKLMPETADYLTRLDARIEEQSARFGYSPEFAMSVDYRLVLTRNPGKADIVLNVGEGGKPTRILKVPTDPSKTHPMVFRLVAEAIRSHTQGQVSLTVHDLTCILQEHKIENGGPFYYRGAVGSAPRQFSAEFVEWLKREIDADPAFLTKCRQGMKQRRAMANKGGVHHPKGS